MPTIQQIINAGDHLMLTSEQNLISGTRSIELLVYAALMEFFDNADISNGILSSSPKAEEFLAYLDYKVYQALNKSGYKDTVKDFIGTFDLIGANVQDLQQKLKNGLIPDKDINPIKRLQVASTLSALTEQGMYNDFITPVRQGLYRSLLFGATTKDTEQLIRSYVISTDEKPSRLLKYVGQVATDSLRQYDGSINQVAKVSLDLNATQYVGSLIEDSRAQCEKWVSMSIIKDEDLQAEIDFALERRNYGNKKCSGMIPGTNPSNFCALRGGYKCRHRAIPVFLAKR